MTISKIPITVVELNLLKFKLQLGAVSNERTWFKALIFKSPFRNNNLTRTKTSLSPSENLDVSDVRLEKKEN